MGDFYQNGVITTLHNLSKRPLEEMEKELLGFSEQRPLGLVLPCLYSELEGPALGKIVDEISKVPYLSQVIIGLDRADEKQYRHAREFFSRLPQPHRVLWNDGPRMMALHEKLNDEHLAPTEMGKGRNVWYCLGYVLVSKKSEAIALHDCDIVTYDRSLLARLIYPVANPHFNYRYAKGYYSRIGGGKLGGRVTRILVTPLTKALKKIVGQSEWLEFLDSFRFPLAGEFSMRKDVINDLRLQSDWGLEVGLLFEMKRHYASNRICQVDIADIYDHKHQKMSADDAEKGLSKMSIDICKAVFRKLATNGAVFSPHIFRTIKATYYATALDYIEKYRSEATMNGLDFDRHQEEKAAELFAQNIVKAGNYYLENPMESPVIPSWNRAFTAFPEIKEEFAQAVEADHEQFA